MAKETDRVNKGNGIIDIIVHDTENNTSWKAYKIDKNKKVVKFYPNDSQFFVDHITFKGFKTIPDELSENGYFKSGMGYYFNKHFKDYDISSFTIDRNQDSSFRKSSGKYKVIMSYASFKNYKENMTNIINESKSMKAMTSLDFLAQEYPKKYISNGESAKSRASKVIKNLSKDIIKYLSQDDINLLGDIYSLSVKEKYKSKNHRYELISKSKIKMDYIAIDEVIDEFQTNLDKDISESQWGKFLQKNLYLIESKYIHIISELNLSLATWRKVDFGLVDIQGYLDIFEIKKSSTKLLNPKEDRGNYFWHTDAIKAIMQAEKYLYAAERKAATLVEDIKREKDIDVKVIKPRAVLIIGSSNQLDNYKKKQDFRILCNSLKNIEVILYDELLDRLRNQKNKSY